MLLVLSRNVCTSIFSHLTAKIYARENPKKTSSDRLKKIYVRRHLSQQNRMWKKLNSQLREFGKLLHIYKMEHYETIKVMFVKNSRKCHCELN